MNPKFSQDNLVGAEVGALVGAAVGDDVGENDGAAVGALVGLSVPKTNEHSVVVYAIVSVLRCRPGPEASVLLNAVPALNIMRGPQNDCHGLQY